MEFFAVSPTSARHAKKVVAAAFPAFSKWQLVNKDDSDHWGCTVWGELEMDPGTDDSRWFYVTFSAGANGWRGDLTIGQHAYAWASADFGDAYLASTAHAHATIEDAVAALLTELQKLFRAFVHQPPAQNTRSAKIP